MSFVWIGAMSNRNGSYDYDHGDGVGDGGGGGGGGGMSVGVSVGDHHIRLYECIITIGNWQHNHLRESPSTRH